MNFREAYKKLEENFRHQVEEDKKLGIESIFLPNMVPKAPVDYVLIGMEPSLLGFARSLDDAEEKIDKGYRNFCGVWAIHFPVKNYLLLDGQTYYVTDLAKGSMPTNSTGAGRLDKYERWFPLLEKELGLVAKLDARIISIGNVVGGFLASKGLYRHVGTIPHYSRQAAGSWWNEIKRTNREGEYQEFAGGIPTVPRNACIPDHDCWPNADPTAIALSDSYKKLMFNYKVRFDRIREQERSGWKAWQKDWQRNMTTA